MALHAYQTFCRYAAMAGDPAFDGADWISESENYFLHRIGETAKAAGLSLNRATFEALTHVIWPPEVLNTAYPELPNQYVFNPYRGLRHATAGEVVLAVKPEAAMKALEQGLRDIIAAAPDVEPEAEDYCDMESAFNNGNDVGTYEQATRARKALRNAGIQLSDGARDSDGDVEPSAPGMAPG